MGRLNSTTLSAIDSQFRAQTSRVFKVQISDQSFLVKGQRPARDSLAFWLLRSMARVFGDSLARPVPDYGGKRAQDLEVSRLQSLAQAGLPVPEVLHQSEDYVVLPWIESRALDSYMTSSPLEAAAMFSRGLMGIRQVHEKGQYLSQGFARNILVSVDALWFIDFEDDPLEVMSLAQAQARDYVLFLLSTVWLNPAAAPHFQEAWRAISSSVPAPVRDLLLDVTRQFGWLRHLPARRKPLGRDALQAQAAAQFLNEWRNS